MQRLTSCSNVVEQDVELRFAHQEILCEGESGMSRCVQHDVMVHVFHTVRSESSAHRLP